MNTGTRTNGKQPAKTAVAVWENEGGASSQHRTGQGMISRKERRACNENVAPRERRAKSRFK